MLQDGVVKRTLDARLEVAVQVNELQDVCVVLALEIDVAVEHDLPFSERARLVSAENIDAAEILDCRQLLDQDLLLRHPLGTLGQRHRDDHGHHFRCHADSKRDREEERLQHRTMEDDVHQQDEKNKQHGHPGEHHSEVAYATTELRLRWPHSQSIRDLTTGGIFPGTDDDSSADPRLNCRAQENAVARVCDGVLLLGKVSHRLLYGQRFPGEDGLAHMEVVYLQQTGVCWHQVSCVEPDDISWDQLGGRQFLFSPIPHHCGGKGNLLLNVLHGMPGLEFHQEIQDYAEQYDREDDQAADVLSERKRYTAGNDKDDDERVTEETKETEQCSEARLMDQAVGAVKTQSPPCLFGRQPCRSCR